MAASWMMMLMMILGDGGNHLLDYASTQAYWAERATAVTVEAMMAELRVSDTDDVPKLIVELGSPQPEVRLAAAGKLMQLGEAALPQLQKAGQNPDPETSAAALRLIEQIRSGGKAHQVRRLMAIRALGELGQKEGLAALRPLADSKEMFIGGYARRAIAAIEGRELDALAAPEGRRGDVALMPAEVRALIQLTVPGRTRPTTLEQVVEAAPVMPGMDKQAMLAEMTSAIISLAEQIGDVRLDAVTVGISGDVGPDAGYAAVVVRGEYDAKAVGAMIERMGVAKQAVEGVDVYSPERQFAFIFADGRGVALLGPNAETLPTARMVRALQTGRGEIHQQKEMAGLLEKVDQALPLWGIMHVTDTFRQAPALAPFDTVLLAAGRRDDKLDVVITAQGSDAAGVGQTVQMVNASVQEALPGLRGMAQQMPMMRSILEVAESIRATADGARATLTMSMKQDAGIMMPMMLFGVRAAPGPVPAPVQVVPGPGD
jgi:hypothetical protein